METPDKQGHILVCHFKWLSAYEPWKTEPSIFANRFVSAKYQKTLTKLQSRGHFLKKPSVGLFSADHRPHTERSLPLMTLQ